MQLYHHAFSMNSQKVKLALEEKGMDYISHSLNPLKGRDLDADFFQINPDGKIPVFKNGDRIFFETITIIQFIDSVNEPLGKDDVDRDKVQEWLRRIDEWDSKLFTLSHIPFKVCKYFSRFKRRVAIARMARNPDLASKYHAKLHKAYATEEMLKDTEALEENKKQLESILDAAEAQLATTEYLAGGSFTMADVMMIPVLGWMQLLGVEKELMKVRPRLWKYWLKAKHRPSYQAVIGRYFAGWNRYRTLVSTALYVALHDLFRRY